MSERELDLIAALPSAIVPAARRERTRTRCHRALARHGSASPDGPRSTWRRWARTFVGLGTRYLASAARQRLRIGGMR
jgi:hypothetical protein